jgi:hypothetical protein
MAWGDEKLILVEGYLIENWLFHLISFSFAHTANFVKTWQ